METAPPPAPPRPTRKRRAAYVVLVLAVGLIGLSVAIWVRSSGRFSYFAGPESWRGVDVSPTTLEQTGWRKYVEGGAWRNLSFDLTPTELRDLGRCQRLAMRQGVTIDGVNEFAEEATGGELESIVKQRPGLFYGEYALSKWYAVRGDRQKGDDLMRRAYADAPVVLVQRYERPDGTPVAGLHVRTYSIECNRVKKHSLDPSLKLTYWDLTTDAKGCIYLPAYDTVYRTDSRSFPDGVTATYPRLGWFAVRGKVGVLPAATVTP